MNEQMILLGNGQQVMAEIVGALGVHQDTANPDWWMVTHIKSGAYIGCFSYDLDALEFAAQADKLMDLDAYMIDIAKSGVKRAKAAFNEQIHAVLKLRSSYTTWIPESDERPEMGRKAIQKRVQI